ncbi:hypothetical protein [Acinetobacter larvae]|uniref:Pilus assembly protein PilX n=1 Tax=Acinetobacter larvae TaxID=1789224 RepID=A0A1B2LWK1_9GAMM|nr:hypothetical protein [Acinetobacter larvae]AOA57143.1 hypothetical protein BFG52_01435 [Acinetobacter larvae]
MKLQQSGATLLLMLCLLLPMSMLGILAAQQSLLNIQLVTHIQARQLLQQATLAIGSQLQHYYQQDDQQDTQLGQQLIAQQLAHTGREMIFCFRPNRSNAENFSLAQASYLSNTASNINSNSRAQREVHLTDKGFCQFDQAQDYASASKAQLVQINLVQLPSAASHGILQTQSLSNGQARSDASHFRIYITAILPQLSASDFSTVAQCFHYPQYARAGSMSQQQCLTQQGAVFQSQFFDLLWLPKASGAPREATANDDVI